MLISEYVNGIQFFANRTINLHTVVALIFLSLSYHKTLDELWKNHRRKDIFVSISPVTILISLSNFHHSTFVVQGYKLSKSLPNVAKHSGIRRPGNATTVTVHSEEIP